MVYTTGLILPQKQPFLTKKSVFFRDWQAPSRFSILDFFTTKFQTI
jgi:hypothetical protein